MEKRVVISLTSTLVLLLAWRFFNLFLSVDKIDLFLFYELEQEPHWYVYNSSQYIREIIMSGLVHAMVRIHYPRVKSLSFTILTLSVVRLVIYWLFRGSLNLEFTVVSIVIFSALLLSKWRK